MLKKVGRVSAKCKLLEGRCGNGTGLLDYGGHLLCYVYISCHMPVDLLHGTRRERMEVAAILSNLYFQTQGPSHIQKDKTHINK